MNDLILVMASNCSQISNLVIMLILIALGLSIPIAGCVDREWTTVYAGIASFILIVLLTAYACFWTHFPSIYEVREDEDVVELQNCLPHWHHTEDGTRLKLHMDSVYIYNPYHKQLVLTQIHYTQIKELIRTPAPGYTRDTLTDAIIRLPNKVSAFCNAPVFLEFDSKKTRFRVQYVVGLTEQELSSPTDSLYRPLTPYRSNFDDYTPAP